MDDALEKQAAPGVVREHRPWRRGALTVLIIGALVGAYAAGTVAINRFGCATGESDSCPGGPEVDEAHARAFSLAGRPVDAATFTVTPSRGDPVTLTADGSGRACIRRPEGQVLLVRVDRLGSASGPVDPRFRDPAVLRDLQASYRDVDPPNAIVLSDSYSPPDRALAADLVVTAGSKDRAASCTGGIAPLPWRDWGDVSGFWQPAVLGYLGLFLMIAAPVAWFFSVRPPRRGQAAGHLRSTVAHRVIVVAWVPMIVLAVVALR